MGQPLAYFEITSNQVEAQQNFYANMFGWKVNQFPDMGGYAIVDPQAGEGAVAGGIGPAYRAEGITVYFYVEDLEAALAKAEELGGKRVQEPTPIPGFGNFAVFSDLDGNAVGLWDRPSA